MRAEYTKIGDEYAIKMVAGVRRAMVIDRPKNRKVSLAVEVQDEVWEPYNVPLSRLRETWQAYETRQLQASREAFAKARRVVREAGDIAHQLTSTTGVIFGIAERAGFVHLSTSEAKRLLKLYRERHGDHTGTPIGDG